uniref:40S ribosomal protein S15A n=1 Tax=Lotharella oceanica TaxID=641309 RepID=A0A7S2TFF6_9EUKA|mmetsp:Transcript_11542/g.22163  ORF Transcript_11542/g.22163 Transcript_11542/m.22163 type:complete len:116 (+) Transcript_11542:54-401(+)
MQREQGKKQVLIRPINKIFILFLKKMLKYEYIKSFQIIDDHRTGKILVHLLGRINKCGCVTPRYSLSVHQISLYRRKILPSKLFGKILLSTSIGIIEHTRAINEKIGGKIIGYFF